MKVFFVAIFFLIPLYIWYRFIMRIDRVFFDGRTKDVVLYLMVGVGWIILAFGMVRILDL
jgi:hypothetical protein